MKRSGPVSQPTSYLLHARDDSLLAMGDSVARDNRVQLPLLGMLRHPLLVQPDPCVCRL